MPNVAKVTNVCAQSAVAISTLISELETIRTNLSVAAGDKMKPLEMEDSSNDSFTQLLFDLERLQERADRLESEYSNSPLGDSIFRIVKCTKENWYKGELSNGK